jgi:hypothetical protein
MTQPSFDLQNSISTAQFEGMRDSSSLLSQSAMLSVLEVVELNMF